MFPPVSRITDKKWTATITPLPRVLTRDEALARAEQIWPDEGPRVEPLVDGDWLIDLFSRKRGAVHLLDRYGRAVCHDTCRVAGAAASAS